MHASPLRTKMIPTFSELIEQFSSFASTPAAVGVLITAGIIVAITDWRASVFALACQSIFAGLLFSRVLPPQLAGVKMIVGLLICVQIFLTARQIASKKKSEAKTVIVNPDDQNGTAEAASPDQSPFKNIAVGLPFRVVAVIMIMIVGWQLWQVPDLNVSGLPSAVSLATFGLAGLGLLGLGLTEEPLKVGILLITVLMGFEMYYAAVEPSLAVMALLAIVDFAVTLGACYLAAVRRGEA